MQRARRSAKGKSSDTELEDIAGNRRRRRLKAKLVSKHGSPCHAIRLICSVDDINRLPHLRQAGEPILSLEDDVERFPYQEISLQALKILAHLLQHDLTIQVALSKVDSTILELLPAE